MRTNRAFILRTGIGIGLWLAVALAAAPASAEEDQKLQVPERVLEKREPQKKEVPPPSGLSRQKETLSPTQVKPELHEQKKGLRLEKPPLQLLEPHFSCSIDLMSQPVRWGMGYGMDLEGHWQVRFGIVNDAGAAEVKVVIELWSWDDVSQGFRHYPGVASEIHEYTDIRGPYPHSIIYEEETRGAVSGCHVDDENPQKAICKYRVTTNVSFRQSTASGPTRAPVWGGGQSSSPQWKHGADCEDIVSWQVYDQ